MENRLDQIDDTKITTYGICIIILLLFSLIIMVKNMRQSTP